MYDKAITIVGLDIDQRPTCAGLKNPWKMSEFHSHWRSPSDNLMNWLVRLGSIR